MEDKTVKAQELLDHMYRDLPMFRKKLDRRLVAIVDRGRSVSELVDFVTEITVSLTTFNKSTCQNAATNFVYRRLGWL